MKKRLLSLTLIAALCLSLFPVGTAPALAADVAPNVLWVGGTNVVDGGYWTTNYDGSLTESDKNNYNVYYDGNGNLWLKDANIVGQGTGNAVTGIYAYYDKWVETDIALTIHLAGDNSVSNGYPIHVRPWGGNASLTITGPGSLTATGTSGANGGIFVKGDTSSLTIKEGADVTVNCARSSAVTIVADAAGTGTLTVDNAMLYADGYVIDDSDDPYGICFSYTGNSNDIVEGSRILNVSGNSIVDTNYMQATDTNLAIDASEDSGGIVFAGTEGTVYGDVTLQEDLTIGAGETLTIGEDASLTIPKDKSLTTNGTITNYGTLSGTVVGEGNVNHIPTYTFNYPSTLTLTDKGGGSYRASGALSLSENPVLPGNGNVVVYGTNKAELNTLTLSKEDDPSQTIPFTINGVSKSNPYSAYLDKNQTKVFAVLDGETGEDAYTIEVLCEILDMKEVLSGTYTGTFNLYVGYTTDENVEFDDVVANVDLNQLTRCTVTVKLENTLGLGITTQPSDVTVDEGNAATFNVVASGNIQSYQWQVNSGDGWSDITGATSASYTIDRTTTDMSGNQYRCIVTGADGKVTSSAATLTVRPYDPPYTGKYSYEIVSDVGENGTIDVDRYATEGDQVTITVSPDEAYLLDDLTVTSGGKDVALTDNGDGTYTFTMPSGDVAITSTFAEDPNWTNPEDPSTDVSEIFTDVPANHWAKAAIQYVYDNGLMTGVSDSEFAPEATTTRAMIVSMLARMENVTSAADAGFADVAAGDWYATAVNWAAANGIVSGISDDTFAPNDPITREQLAAMLMNYAQWKGQDISARADLSGYTDAPSTWASEAVQWAVAEGLLAGVTDDQLQPQGQATRAQVAAIFERFLEA